MIETIHARVADLPERQRRIFEQLFDVDVTAGHALPPPEMEAWVIQHFGALDRVREQTIVKIVNRLTLESALFNPLRARRPTRPGGGPSSSPSTHSTSPSTHSTSPSTHSTSPSTGSGGASGQAEALEAWIARELAEHDIFRDPERDTTADVFGRIRGQYCVTASNVAKYAGWHGVVIFDEPHPLRFGPAQLRDYLDVALRWLAAAHDRDPLAIYPMITWNCLPKSGATIMHGHMQLALTRGMHYTHVERWRRAAEAYRASSGARYFDDLFALHDMLGLAIPRDNQTRAFAHLTPARDREIVLLAQALTPVAVATPPLPPPRAEGGVANPSPPLPPWRGEEEKDSPPLPSQWETSEAQRAGWPGGEGLSTAATPPLPSPRAEEGVANPSPPLPSQWETSEAQRAGWPGGEGLPTALATILRRLIDEQGVRAFNVGIALPPLAPAPEDWSDMPIIARIADRGDPLTTRADMGAMELFATNVITADPFEVAAKMNG